MKAINSGKASPTFGHANANFSVLNNDLNLHNMAKLSGWLRYWLLKSSI